MKEDYQKVFKKLILFFLSNPVPFNGQSYQKHKGSRTSDRPVAFQVTKQNNFKNISLFVIHYLTKFHDIMQSSFWVILKITPANLCKSIDDVINYSTSICPFESGKCGKKEKNLEKSEYLENEKSFLDEIKNTFHSF